MANYIPKSTLDQPISGNPTQEKREKQAPVITGETKEKKKTLWTRIKEEFISEDRQSIGEYLIFDVLIPTIKETIITMGQNSIEMIFNGRSGYRSRNYGRAYDSRSSYRQYYDQRDYNKPRISSGYDYNEILFASRGDADAVLYRMQEILNQYQIVSVADYLELSGRSSSHTDYNYGWTNLYGTRILKDRSGGYYLELPRPMALD